jgi:uncharacterized protein
VCRWFESDCRYILKNTVVTLSFVRIPITIKSCERNLVGIYHPARIAASTVPLVIMCHGLGGDKCGRGRILVSLSEILAKKDIASLRFDFLGSGDSEGVFSDLTPQICIQNLIDVIQSAHHSVHFGPLGLFGRSFGGYICLQASSSIKGLKAVAVQSPPFDAEAFSSLPPHFQAHLGKLSFMGEPISEKFLPQMQQLDMEGALHGLKEVPLLHIACENDRVISTDHTEKFKKARSVNRAPTHFEYILGADHECSSFIHRNIVLEKVAAWFVEFLKTSL